MKRRCGKDDPVVVLDIGGKSFKARRSTLVNGSSYFVSLLSGEWADALDDELVELFVDRDPSLFQHILQLMRSGNAEAVRRLDDSLRASVLDEARFFGVPIPGRQGWEDWPRAVSKQYVVLQRVVPIALNNGGHLTMLAGTITRNGQQLYVDACQLCSVQPPLIDLCRQHGPTEQIRTKYDALIAEFRAVCTSDAQARLRDFGGPYVLPHRYYSADGFFCRPVGIDGDLVFDAMRTLGQCGFHILSFDPLFDPSFINDIMGRFPKGTVCPAELVDRESFVRVVMVKDIDVPADENTA